MVDIGDDVRVAIGVRVEGALTDPSEVTLAVTAPDGTTSSPAVGHPELGMFEALVSATAAGRWRYTWTTTGPAAVQHGYFDVASDPPPPGRLDPLATPGDLFDRGLEHDQPATVQALLAAASSEVRRAAGAPISRATYTVDLPGTDQQWLHLPGQPIVTVTEVLVDGEPVGGWRLIGGALWRRGGWQRRHEPVLVRVTITGGLLAVPADIVDLVCAMVGAGLGRIAEGGYEIRGDLTGVRIDDYSEQYSTAVHERLAGVMELPPRTAERLAARFGGGSHVVGASR